MYTVCLKDFQFVLYIWIAEVLKRTWSILKISFPQTLFNFYLFFL